MIGERVRWVLTFDGQRVEEEGRVAAIEYNAGWKILVVSDAGVFRSPALDCISPISTKKKTKAGMDLSKVLAGPVQSTEES